MFVQLAISICNEMGLKIVFKKLPNATVAVIHNGKQPLLHFRLPESNDMEELAEEIIENMCNWVLEGEA